MDAIMEKQLEGREPEPSSNPDTAEAIDGAETPVGSEIPPRNSLVDGINNRKDVIRLLDRICTYYQHFEPGSPVPLLLKRARHLVEKNFIEIIQDLAPDSAGKIKSLIAGDDKEES
jgi:type VI secretion system protein ImpA